MSYILTFSALGSGAGGLWVSVGLSLCSVDLSSGAALPVSGSAGGCNYSPAAGNSSLVMFFGFSISSDCEIGWTTDALSGSTSFLTYFSFISWCFVPEHRFFDEIDFKFVELFGDFRLIFGVGGSSFLLSSFLGYGFFSGSFAFDSSAFSRRWVAEGCFVNFGRGSFLVSFRFKDGVDDSDGCTCFFSLSFANGRSRSSREVTLLGSKSSSFYSSSTIWSTTCFLLGNLCSSLDLLEDLFGDSPLRPPITVCFEGDG
mgnify:CR=1 FL=1